MKPNIVAIVVTYNRKKLLAECLASIISQDYKVNKIVIIDNNSTDGTYDYLRENGYLNKEIVSYTKLEKNIGGAGGFNEGFKKAQSFSPDFLWVMDDDTIPKKNCLKELVNSFNLLKNEKISYLASSIYGEKGEYMNVPTINNSHSENGYPSWYSHLADGLVKIREATFVSLLINNKAVEEVGYPVKFYFIWGDDTEYTLRLNRYYGAAYMVGSSIAIHKRKLSKKISILTEDNANRVNFHYYMVRNNLINKKEYFGFKEMAKYYLKNQVKALACLLTPRCKFRLRKFIKVHQALLSFTFGIYDKKGFKNRLNRNVENNQGKA